MRFDSRKLLPTIFALAAAIVAGPHQAAAQQRDKPGCEARAHRLHMKGGLKKTYIRECMAGAKLDARKRKTFDSAATPKAHKNTRCLAASKMGKCER